MKKRTVEFLYLQQEDCIKAGGFDMVGTLKAVERSFFLHGKDDFIQPLKPVIRWGGPETEETIGRVMSMPAYLGGTKFAKELKDRGLLGPVNTTGLKFIPSRPDNPRKYNLPRASAIIILLDPDTFMPVCIMDGTLVSAMRTGASSGVAAKYLANTDSAVFAQIGAGVQGITQLLAIKTALPSLELCKVFDISKKASEKFVYRMKKEVCMKFQIVGSAEEAIKNSDVISTATMAKKPYINSEWYKEGVLHCEISFWDTHPKALKIFDFVVVDDWFQVKHHGVDVSWRAVKEGVIPKEKIRANLGEIIVGKKVGRKNKKERIFFNPIGLGIHDLSEAHRIYQNALKAGIGKKLLLWENPFLV